MGHDTTIIGDKTMTDREKMIDKVKKLLRLSESTNQAEAELAMQRANDIIRNFQLDEDEISISGDQYEFGTFMYEFPNLRMKYVWTKDLARAAAVLFDCEMIYNRTLHKSEYTIIGPKGNFEAVKAMADYLFNSWKSIVERDLVAEKRKWWDEHQFRFQPKHSMKFKLAHGQHFSQTIRHRAEKIAKERKEQVVQAQGTGRDLVVAAEADILNYIKKYTVMRKTKQQVGLKSGAEAGRKAGEEIPLGGGITEGVLRIGSK